MSADTELRAAYRALADSAPSLDTLTIPGSAVARGAGTRRIRGQRLAVVATVAVIALIVGTLVVVGHRRHRTEPAAPPVDPAHSWQFGPRSLSGYVPTEFEATPTAVRYAYVQIPTNVRQQSPSGHVLITEFSPDAPARAAVSGLDRTTVHGVRGWSGSVDQAATCRSLRLLSAYCPGNVAIWPLDAGRLWVVVMATPSIGRLVTPFPSLPVAQVVALTGRIRPDPALRVASVRVGYLPPGMRLTSLTTNPQVNLKGQWQGLQVLDFAAGARGATVELRVQVAGALNLASATAAELAQEFGGGPWTRITIHGRAAWQSPTAVVIQSGSTLVTVGSQADSPAATTVIAAERLKIAGALTDIVPVEFDAGSTLPQAVPPGTLW